MKKIILFIATILFSTCVWADPVQEPAQAHDNESVDVTNNFKVIPQTRHDQDAATYSTYDINYPQISGSNPTAAVTNFNKAVNEIVNEELTKFKKLVKIDLPHVNTLPEADRKNTYHMDYDIDVIHPGKNAVISIRFSIEGVQAGRAHPFHAHRVLNFDFGQNKILKLSDLFHHNSKYLYAISNYSIKQLNAPLAQNKDLPEAVVKMREGMIKDGAQAKEDNFKNWNIESDGILITFDEYQVAPYTEGSPEAEIPFIALQSMLSTNSSLAPCIKQSAHCSERQTG